MFLFAFESVSPVHIALQITAEDVLERKRASTVLFRVLGKLTQIGFVAAALDDPVVLTSEYFAPEADNFDLVLSC